jgi:hypothetical protein
MTSSLAERLGFEREDRVAVVHVDDLGMCHAANEGGFEALRRGPASCGSIMVPCPWFREAAELARAEPGLDLGVHLTLNAEWPHYRWGPVAGRRAVPSLVDAQGYLPRTALETVRGARPEEVEVELRAQVEMRFDAGIDILTSTRTWDGVLPPSSDLREARARLRASGLRGSPRAGGPRGARPGA